MGPQIETKDGRANRVDDVGEAFRARRRDGAPAPVEEWVREVGAHFGRRRQAARRSSDSGRVERPLQGDRRQEPRIKAIDLVHVEEHCNSTLGRYKTEDSIGRTVDLSHDGMRLELLDHALPVRTHLWLDLQLGNALLRIEGRIRSVQAVDARTSEHGVEFLNVTPEQYDTLDVYLHLRGD